MTVEEKRLFSNFYSLTEKQILDIKEDKSIRGMGDLEISRKYQITPPDVRRVLHPIPGYKNWSAEDKARHWLAGKRRANTVKKNRDEKMQANKPKFLL